jgi:hypothetical protein
MGLRKAAEGVIDRINRVFAGTGIVTARALAYDANRVKEVLKTETLPAQLGAANREQMLKKLGVNVSSDHVVLEQTATRFALGVMNYPKIDAGDREYAYLTALYQLGVSIDWELLDGSGRTTGRKPGDSRF